VSNNIRLPLVIELRSSDSARCETTPEDVDNLVLCAERIVKETGNSIHDYLQGRVSSDFAIQLYVNSPEEVERENQIDLISAPRNHALPFIFAYPLAVRDLKEYGSNINWIWLLEVIPADHDQVESTPRYPRYRLLGKTNWITGRKFDVPKINNTNSATPNDQLAPTVVVSA